MKWERAGFQPALFFPLSFSDEFCKKSAFPLQRCCENKKRKGYGMRRIVFGALLCLSLLTSCEGVMSRVRPPLEEEGDLLLYLEPFPQEANRIRFTIDGLFVRGADGREFAASLRLTELKAGELTRQRLLGAVRLPQGSYLGFSVRIKSAFLRGEEGDAALLVPDTPVKIDFPFQVIRKRGYLVTLAFKPAGSVKSGFAFNPLFLFSIPPKPIAGLTGYVTNYDDGNVIIVDKRAGRAAGVIPTGGAPAGMALDQKGRKAYVALPTVDAIEVIDVTAGEVTDRMALNTGDHPYELALSPDGKTLFAANRGSNTVSVIDLTSLSESGRIPVGNGPASILMDPTGKRLFVFNSLSSTISVLDVANKALATTISTDPGPLRGQFNRKGDRFYVIHEWSPYLSIVDATSLSVLRRMSVGMGMRSIKVDANTDLVYIGKDRDAEVGIYEPNSFVPVDFIRTGAGVSYLTVDGDENTIVMLVPELQQLLTVNLIGKRVSSVVDVGEAPYWVTVMGER